MNSAILAKTGFYSTGGKTIQIQTIQTNTLKFSYYEMGSGENVIFCFHGFPDTADTWHDLMPALAEDGYRVIAPFLRGYPPTDFAPDGDYSALALAQDGIALLDAFDVQSATIIGHDWGAFMAYAMTAYAPERVKKLVTIAIPHPRSIKPNFMSLWKSRHFIGFQFRQSSVKWLSQNNYAGLHKIYKRWSPKWDFSDDELTEIKKAFATPEGIEGALGYYWSFWSERSNEDVQKLLRAKTPVPTLTLLGDSDGALHLTGLGNVERAYTASYEQVILPDVGHFLHRENPDDVAKHIRAFLQKD